MAYQVIARKWRPQKFSDMVGQEQLSRTLRNAVMTGRIAHAYLFVGPRGIGKTTTARIFAKAINCLHPVDGEPCCQCSSCKSIANETNVDVIEIDAATHTQVEKARELCEDVLHLPISSKYKIYIIDEVHMLSKSAWNALLKTIEEPPEHAKFIFATTEVNKVLPTVISRCQRFDLRRIKTPDIAARLRLICDTEKIPVTDGALEIIARYADGGMRDAQSLLDQMISFFGDGGKSEITEDQAQNLFGLAANADMENLMRAIVTNDRAGAVTAVHRLAEEGKNLELLYEEIISWLRGILLSRIVDDPAQLLEASQEKVELYRSFASTANPNMIQRLMEQLASSGYLIREAINKQVFVESILLKAMRIAHAVQIEDLIARLNQLRNAGELDAVRSVVPLYEMPVGQIVVPRDSPLAPAAGRKTAVQIVPADSVSIRNASAQEPVKKTPAPAASRPEPAVEAPRPAPESAPSEPERREEETASVEMSGEDEPEPEPPRMPESGPSGTEQTAENSESEASDSIQTDDPEYSAASPDNDGVPVSQMPRDNGSPEELWQRMIIDVRDNLKKHFLAVAMADGTPERITGSALTVAFDQDYEMLQYQTVEKEIGLLARRLCDLSGDPASTLQILRRTGLATPMQIREREDVEKLKRQAEENALVNDALILFRGHLADAHNVGNDRMPDE